MVSVGFDLLLAASVAGNRVKARAFCVSRV
jgi:hypothetical protein